MREAWLGRQAYSVAALRRLARRRLPRVGFDFVDGGAGGGGTLRAKEAAFAEVELGPPPLDGTSLRSQAVELLGHQLALPVGIGPTGLAGMLWPEGELAAARAAAEAGTLSVVQHGSAAGLQPNAAPAPAAQVTQGLCPRGREPAPPLLQRPQ